MKEHIRFELFETKKFIEDFAYVSNLSQDEKNEINTYRANLVKILTSDAMPTVIPPRPPVFDRYN